MRRLPVFFVLDCSESMAGDNLNKMEQGLQAIVRSLRTDPHALETVYISVVAFAGIAQTVVPLVELVSFYPPRLPLGGGTSLGLALTTLMDEIDRSVVKTTLERKGDWKPIVYLFTDGRPTDNPDVAIERWNADYAKKANLIAVGLGAAADFATLRRVSDNVIAFEDSHHDDFKKFINWVTASVAAQSKSVAEGLDGSKAGLPILDPTVMRLLKNPPSRAADESCVTLVGRCHKTSKPYMIKYDRLSKEVATSDFKVQVPFQLTGCYALDESYFDWTDTRQTDLKVNTSELIGTPGCPHCGNISAFAACSCGKLLCVNGPEPITCPWCRRTVAFGRSEDGSNHEFDVGRGRG
jgi:uncharacterized protein YegL